MENPYGWVIHKRQTLGTVFSLELSVLVLPEKGTKGTGGKIQCPAALEKAQTQLCLVPRAPSALHSGNTAVKFSLQIHFAF